MRFPRTFGLKSIILSKRKLQKLTASTSSLVLFFILFSYYSVMTTFLDFSRKDKYYLNKDIKQNNY